MSAWERFPATNRYRRVVERADLAVRITLHVEQLRQTWTWRYTAEPMAGSYLQGPAKGPGINDRAGFSSPRVAQQQAESFALIATIKADSATSWRLELPEPPVGNMAQPSPPDGPVT